MKIDKQEMKVILAYIAVCLAWGSTYLAIRIGVSGADAFPPELFTGIRFILAGGAMLLFAYFRGHAFPTSFTDVRRLATAGLFMLLGGNGVVVWVEQWMNSGVAAILLATVPLFSAIIEMFIPEGSRIGLKGWAGLLVGFGGVVLLVSSGSGVGAMDLTGSVMLLVASILFACGSVYSKTFKVPGSFVTHAGIQMLAGGLGQCLTGIILGELPRIHFTYKSVGAMIFLMLIGGIVGYSAYAYTLQKWSAAKAGTYAYVNTVVAVILGALVLGEIVNFGVIMSTAIILGGVIMVQFSKNINVKLQ